MGEKNSTSVITTLNPSQPKTLCISIFIKGVFIHSKQHFWSEKQHLWSQSHIFHVNFFCRFGVFFYTCFCDTDTSLALGWVLTADDGGARQMRSEKQRLGGTGLTATQLFCFRFRENEEEITHKSFQEIHFINVAFVHRRRVKTNQNTSASLDLSWCVDNRSATLRRVEEGVWMSLTDSSVTVSAVICVAPSHHCGV